MGAGPLIRANHKPISQSGPMGKTASQSEAMGSLARQSEGRPAITEPMRGRLAATPPGSSILLANRSRRWSKRLQRSKPSQHSSTEARSIPPRSSRSYMRAGAAAAGEVQESGKRRGPLSAPQLRQEPVEGGSEPYHQYE